MVTRVYIYDVTMHRVVIGNNSRVLKKSRKEDARVPRGYFNLTEHQTRIDLIWYV